LKSIGKRDLILRREDELSFVDLWSGGEKCEVKHHFTNKFSNIVITQVESKYGNFQLEKVSKIVRKTNKQV